MVKIISIILLLISVNSFANIKIEIINKDNQVMSQTFDTPEEKDAYIARLKHKWGSEKGWYKKTCYKPELLIETRQVENEFGLSITEYHCEKSYSVVEVEGYAEEMAAKKAKEEADKIRIEELKAKDKTMKLEELIELLQLKGII
jgi:hypothetical protein